MVIVPRCLRQVGDVPARNMRLTPRLAASFAATWEVAFDAPEPFPRLAHPTAAGSCRLLLGGLGARTPLLVDAQIWERMGRSAAAPGLHPSPSAGASTGRS